MQIFSRVTCVCAFFIVPLRRKGQNSQTATAMTTLTQEQKEALMADLRSFDDTWRVDDFGESK